MKKIFVSVTNDLVADNRVHKVCNTLNAMGFEVTLVGRRLPGSASLAPRNYAARRLRLLFHKGPLFYACFNIRLFLWLLIRPFDLLLANDLDTLPAMVLAGKLKRKPVIFDSHEFFTEVPELVHRPRIRKIWQRLEKMLVPQVSDAYTVCDSIASEYVRMYGISFQVVRNLPMANPSAGPQYPAHEQPKKPAIIYQGALNMGRGLAQAIRAMDYLPEAELVIAGSGDLETELRDVASKSRHNNIRFTGRLPLEEVFQLTLTASLGISIEEDLGLNYRYALPNKLFDYIQARIPVVVTDLPEMKRIVESYGVGLVTPSLEPGTLAETFRIALSDLSLRTTWAQNLETAARTLTWQNEEPILQKIFSKYL